MPLVAASVELVDISRDDHQALLDLQERVTYFLEADVQSVAAETAPAADADVTSGLSLCVQPAAEEEGPPAGCAVIFIFRPPSDLHLPSPRRGESLEMSAQLSAQVVISEFR
ncbi:hypothetical protein NDU88_007895 [Pleurodeles waltl]|uniref:Uncharacterized protein n=1 Tax=Pleurodeles waltl TaxID=8319 RepID=A0AAV7STS9_PLEWA|nr:hypothetical protein NDU88_007895 [Pleurodeles waltl]